MAPSIAKAASVSLAVAALTGLVRRSSGNRECVRWAKKDYCQDVGYEDCFKAYTNCKQEQK
ncbi:hypothetical protein FHU37_001390 [Allostreptomyces psammosilenae]|uniref:Uncharacterized protein n=1 Tax=Allostreptomyces psammosilenae TaxID=1892865 RepID=A0A852ZSH4_9ACTN|nr:hypothetical protein [Allostreptomyces psammosilenae]